MSGQGPEPLLGDRLTVILKATDACNGACTFCSVGTSGTHRMSRDDLGRMADEIERVVAARGIRHLGVTFHGGEPTLLGPGWIDAACERFSAIDTDLSLAMQSNLYDIPDEMIDVVRARRIKVGSSFDPIFGTRRDATGRDAFPTWLRSYRKMREAGLDVGSIFVVTREALDRASDLYHACECIGSLGGELFGLQVNPVYPQGRASGRGEMLVEPVEFGRFLVDLWRTWERSGRSVRITPVTQFSQHFDPGFGGPTHLVCSFAGRCAGSHVGIDHDLRVAGCGRRLDSGGFLGSLREAPLDEILETAGESLAIAGRSEALSGGECRGCRFFDICHGGCPDDAAIATGDPARRYQWCDSYRMLFEALEEHFADPPPSRAPEPRVSSIPRPVRTIRAVVDPGEAGGEEVDEVWVLPTQDARSLAWDGGLERIPGSNARLVRVFVHARRARSLTLWEDLLRRRDVRVVLFEAGGLDEALNLLNALGATVELDVARILDDTGGAEAIDRATSRFLEDPIWRSQVLPLTTILSRTIHGPLASPTGDVLLGPGALALARIQGEPTGAGREIVENARRLATTSPADWLLARAACRICRHYRVCGGMFARGDGKACHDSAMRLVERVRETGERVLAEGPASRPATP